MKDINGFEFEVGDIFLYNNRYARILDLSVDSMLVTCYADNIESACKNMWVGFTWHQEEIKNDKFRIVQRALLPVTDKNGNALYKYDTVVDDGEELVVVGGLKSINGDDVDYVFIDSCYESGGWTISETSDVIKISKPEMITFTSNTGEKLVLSTDTLKKVKAMEE